MQILVGNSYYNSLLSRSFAFISKGGLSGEIEPKLMLNLDTMHCLQSSTSPNDKALIMLATWHSLRVDLAPRMMYII